MTRFKLWTSVIGSDRSATATSELQALPSIICLLNIDFLLKLPITPLTSALEAPTALQSLILSLSLCYHFNLLFNLRQFFLICYFSSLSLFLQLSFSCLRLSAADIQSLTISKQNKEEFMETLAFEKFTFALIFTGVNSK